MKRFLILAYLGFYTLGCSDKIISKKEILELLEGDGNAQSSSSSNSNANTSRTEDDPNQTTITNSQNLDYHGLTNSNTGTTTGGAVGSPAGANPTGR